MQHQSKSRRHKVWLAIVGLLMFGPLMFGLPAPVHAQRMSNDGGTLPSWFFSRSEQTARRACLNDLPECRDSVRQQIAVEKTLTLVAPWVFTALVLWGAVIYVRRRDAQREARTRQLQRNRTPAKRTSSPAPRRGQQEDEDRGDAKQAAEPDDDGLGGGHPGDHRR